MAPVEQTNFSLTSGSVDGVTTGRMSSWAKFPLDVPTTPATCFSLTGYLVKWAIEVGHLERGSTDEQGLKRHQLGKLTGVLFLKRGKSMQKALIDEAVRYYEEQERVQLQKIAKKYPDAGKEDDAPDGEAEATDTDFDGVDDGFPKTA